MFSEIYLLSRSWLRRQIQNSLWVLWNFPLDPSDSAVLHIWDTRVWRESPEALVFVSPDASNVQPGCRPHCSSSRGCCMKAQDSSRLETLLLQSSRRKGHFRTGPGCPSSGTQAAVWRCWPSEVIWSAGCKEESPCLGRADRVSGFGSCLQQHRMPRCPWAPWLYMLSPDSLHSEDLVKSAREKKSVWVKAQAP